MSCLAFCFKSNGSKKSVTVFVYWWDCEDISRFWLKEKCPQFGIFHAVKSEGAIPSREKLWLDLSVFAQNGTVRSIYKHSALALTCILNSNIMTMMIVSCMNQYLLFSDQFVKSESDSAGSIGLFLCGMTAWVTYTRLLGERFLHHKDNLKCSLIDHTPPPSLDHFSL